MSKMSRVQKYRELRDNLQNGSDTTIETKEVNDFVRKVSGVSEESPIQKIKSENYKTSSQSEASFNNEYLDEFISEVKQYNKDLGLRSEDNTQLNILNSIYQQQQPQKTDVQPTVKKETTEIPFMNKASNPYQQLTDDELETRRNTIALEVKNLINGEVYGNSATNQHTIDEDLMQKTDRLRMRVEENEESLSQVDEKIETTNRILNFILVLIVFALIVVLGLLVYWLLLKEGII